jgi:tripartite-type tricarboxylate transporter receptor subunit TctC
MHAKADGYTIGLSNNQAAVFTPKISKLPYKGPEDYQPIIKLSELPCVLTVRADSPYKSPEEFIQAAKKDPGKLRVSVAGKLTACDLVWQGQFAKEAGINVITAPFTGGAGEAATALLGGQVEASLGDITAVMPHVRAGKMRAIAVFQKERHPLLPDTKSIVEAGYSNTLPITYFVMGPKGMDPKVLETLVAKLREAIAKPAFQEFAKTAGYRLDPKGPDELLAELKAQRADYEKIIAALNIPQQ